MNPPPSDTSGLFTLGDVELLHCLIAAPGQEVAAEWFGCSSTHFRRLLKMLRKQLGVDTNEQLIVLASVSGAIEPNRVLPYGSAARTFDSLN